MLIGLASTKQALGRPEEARAHLEESICYLAQVGDDVAADYSLNNLARSRRRRAITVRRRQFSNRSLPGFAHAVNLRSTASALSSLGDISAAQGDFHSRSRIKPKAYACSRN